MRRQSKDYIKTLKNELDRGNNFIDYFTVIGINNNLIFSDFLYENDISVLNSSELLKPEIISKFPPFDKSTIIIDDNLIKHCFPNGYFLKESQTQPSIESFGFVLDNNFYSISYPQKFISCLIFYESLETYNKAYTKYKNFDDVIKDTYTFDEAQNSIRKTTNFSKYTINDNKENSERPRIADEDMISIRSLRFGVTSKNQKLKNIYVPKCICFASLYPFFLEFGKILKTIYNFSKANRVKKPIEKIIESLVIEVPAPPRGIWKVELELVNEKYELKQPPMNRLPLLNLELEIIFIKFQIDQILEIYKHILIESRIIFFSKEIAVITPIIEGFLSLIYPLKYTFQHVTILPKENFMILEAVTPYIVGINMSFEEDFFQKNEIDVEDITYLIVDIDQKKIELKYPVNDPKYSKKRFLNEEFPDLPKHYKSKLINNLQIYIKEIKNNSKKKEDRESFVRNMREHFFQFIVNIFQDYSKYLNNSYYTNNDMGTPTIQTLFKVDEFLSSVAHIDRLFFKKIMDTQMFVELIYKRMIPKDAKDKIEILFFDEHIIEKNNRKMFTKKSTTSFLKSNVYDYKSTYPISKPRISVDYPYLKRFENMKNALKCGQEIIWENDEMSISYLFFPELMNHVFFKPESRNFIIPSILSEEVDQTNSEIASNSYLGNIANKFSEMDNCVYLCWIQLWSMTFWYHDEIEKKHRFQQMLIVLDKVKNHEMETFNLLFDSVSKYGDDSMVLKLYERLIAYRLNPNYLICTTVMRLVEKKNTNNKTNLDILQYIKTLEYKQEYNVSGFRKRSFKVKSEPYILTNEVNFYLEDSCVECQEFVNLNLLSSNFKDMSREAEWAVCPSCERQFLPKMGVRLGIELNKSKTLKSNTSIYEKVVLYSPLFLKINYNIALIKEFQFKLDVETFRHKYSAFFWDSIWYFKLKDLNYDFFLPYEFEVDLTPLRNVASHFKINRTNSDFKTDVDFELEVKKKFMESYSDCSSFRESIVTKNIEMKSSKPFSIENQNSIIIDSSEKKVFSRNSNQDIEYSTGSFQIGKSYGFTKAIETPSSSQLVTKFDGNFTLKLKSQEASVIEQDIGTNREQENIENQKQVLQTEVLIENEEILNTQFVNEDKMNHLMDLIDKEEN